MPNRQYEKGRRFEKKAQAWLVHLGKCVRAFMSRGADLVLTRHLKEWRFSCKCRAKITDFYLKALLEECEKDDFVIFGADREVQWVLGPLPKMVEMIGQSEEFSQYTSGEEE